MTEKVKPRVSVEGERKRKKEFGGSIHDLIELIQPETTEFLLPTKGLLYPFDRVRIRPMTTREEKKIAGINQKNWNVMINSILRSCVQDPQDFDPKDLTIGDRLSLITFLRITTYGSEYITEMTCPSCGNTSRETYDMKKLEDIWLPDNFKEPHFEKLNSFNGGVFLKLMRISDEMDVEQYVKSQRKFKKITIQDEWSMRYAKTIVGIEADGDEIDFNERDRLTFYESLPGEDSLKIRNFQAKFDHGVKLNVPFECGNCGFEKDDLALSINSSFFFPGQINE